MVVLFNSSIVLFELLSSSDQQDRKELA